MHLARILRRVRQLRGLFDRQRVHVRAQADNAVGVALAAADDPDDAGLADPRYDVVATERFELFGNGGRRP
jgi:hypothetical protein